MKMAGSAAKAQLGTDHTNLGKRQWWLGPRIAMKVVRSKKIPDGL